MPVYGFYRVQAPSAWTKTITAKSLPVKGNRLRSFKVSTDGRQVVVQAADEVEIPFVRRGGSTRGPVNIAVQMGKHQNRNYAIVGLHGEGLTGIRGFSKYIEGEVLAPLSTALEGSGTKASFKPYTYGNEHFSSKFWDEVTSKLGHNPDSHVSLRISSADVDRDIKAAKYLSEYFSTSVVKSIRGRHSMLRQQTGKATGSYVWDYTGILRTRFHDMEVVDSFYKHLASQDFFGVAE